MAFNGFCQSPCWPGLVAIMGNWFGKNSRGLLMGLWSGNSNAGDIIGFYIGDFTITRNDYGWPYCVIAASVFLFSIGIVIKLFVNPYPAT
jgi:sugar phosphate permease